MKKRRRIPAMMMLLMLAGGMFTGCSEPISENVWLENGDIEQNSIVIKVGSTGVKYSEVLGYCYLLKQQYENSFGSQIWDYQLDDSNTIGDDAKEEIINMVTQLKVISATAKEEEVSLTNDERDEALQKAEELLESATDEDKKNYHLTVQGIGEIYEENALANKMFYIATDDADTEVTDEEARQVKIQFFQVLTKGMTKSGVQVALNDKEKSAARKRTNELRGEAVKAESFLDFAKKNTEGSKTEMTIGQDNSELDRSIVTAAFSMKSGEISPVIGTEGGYYVLYCVDDNDEDATYARREAIIEERQTKMFKQKYKKWLGDYEVSISKSFWKIFHI